MSDVVIELPVRPGQAKLFGDYLDRFIAVFAAEAERLAPGDDAPYLIVHSHPQPDRELKVLTFQHRGAADAFFKGWRRALRSNDYADLAKSA